MEKEGKRKKLRREKDESCEKRSPLQNLNGFSNLKNKSKKKSNLSSSSSSAAAVSGKLLAPKNCLSFLLSSNSCSSYSSSSSSSTTHLDKKLKTFPKSANNEPEKKLRSRSKENEIPKKPFPQKSRTNPPQTLTHSKNSENKANPIYKNAQRSKLSSVQNNRVTKLKKGSEQFRAKNSQENGSIERPFELLGVANNSTLNCTPVGKLASGPGLRSVIEDSKDERVNNNSVATVKTPPVEASLSPEIQNQSHSKILVLNSAATPVCYGAGHLISGVTDKRKCRRRGSLKGGSEKVNLFEDEKDLTDDLLRDPSIPLLAEASVRWLLSPCNEGSDCKNKPDECRMACDIDPGASLDVIISSPSGLCGNASDFVCSESRYSGSGSIGNLVDEGRNWNKNKDGFLSANSTRSTVSLSSRNIVETPNSDFSTDVCNGRSRLEKHHTDDFVLSELDSIRETLDMVKLSPRSEVSMWGPPGYNGINRHQENMDSVSSWVSNDATLLDNLALSRIKISWRDDELASGVVETNADELDFCRCLSDEDEKTYLDGERSNCIGVENKENGPRVDNDLSPMILDYEPRISARGKEESVMEKRSVYAESISTDGGGLVASDDSNWTYCCHESQVK
ncbi:hypothetical protein ABFX02_14G289700 [Erythranthe guttata]